jgi:DNA polymerase-1
VHVALQAAADAPLVRLTRLDDSGALAGEPQTVPLAELAEVVAGLEREERPRWVWDDTSRWYPGILAAGVRVDRCVDLRLCRAILRNSTLTSGSRLAESAPSDWDRRRVASGGEPRDRGETLFDLDGLFEDGLFEQESAVEAEAVEADDDPVEEFRLQRDAVEGSAEPGRIGLLLAAESAGSLIAVEMQHAGLPWSAARHDQLLTELLGPRPVAGQRPARLEALLAQIHAALGDSTANPDSPVELVRSLRRAGLQVTSTRSWELKKLEHPVIAPLLEYKKLSRLLSANGWNWAETWVQDGRFHPVYVPGGVVTGRWAADGGGALQLPHQVRGAVVADAGWTLVVADAAQLEPRILAAMSGDEAMAAAGRGRDLYDGIVASGAVDTRAHAKVGMLGAMYGGTTGESGRMLPRLARAYPTAVRFVEDAAKAGEHGGIVTTRLGRSSPLPGDDWLDVQDDAKNTEATEAVRKRAQTEARSWGRFTRNFVVQGTAAEWALCWMAGLRGRLWSLGEGRRFPEGPHLAFFLHDEVMVHTPIELADAVVVAVREAAAEAGRLIFGSAPVEFPVSVAVVDDYGQAKG